MKKSFLFGVKIFFWVAFILGSLSLTAMEMWGLWTMRSQKNVFALRTSGEQNSNNVVVGQGKEDDQEMVNKDLVVAADARPLLLKKYLEKYKSPLVPYSELIFSLSQNYGYDYRWIVAIAQQESNLCKKIPAESYNCWGYGIHSKGTLRFSNYDLALKSFAEYLKKEYFDKGYLNAGQIMKKYCPQSNGSWAFGVNKFMEDIEKG